MVTILPRYTQEARQRKPTFTEKLGLDRIAKEFGTGIGESFKKHEEENELDKKRKSVEKLTGFKTEGLSEGMLNDVVKAYSKYNAQKGMLNELGLGDILNPRQNRNFSDSVLPRENDQGMQEPNQPGEIHQNDRNREISVGLDTLYPQEKILATALVNPALADKMQKRNDTILAEAKHREKMQLEGDKTRRRQFESDRDYHTQFSKKASEETEGLRSSLPKKQMALQFARNAIESENLGYFSKDKLADATGIDLFRTAKGAQLITAGKENLLSNMSKVSSRAQNMWFEQRLNSMFPKIGQSKEANLTVMEMLEGENLLDEAYVNAFDKLADQDKKEYGYVRDDIAKRAHNEIKPIEKEIFQRTSYRMKEIEEQEQGLNDLKKNVGKNVAKGTPFTLAMAKLYTEKFGDKAMEVAKKNGYSIPTLEEFKRYRTTNQEMLDGL